MLAWSEELITDAENQNHGDAAVGGELFTDYPDQILANCRCQTQNSNQQARRIASFFPVGGMPTASVWPERLSPKSQDAVALQQIKERGALPMIDRGDIRQAIDRCSNIQLHRRWRWSVRAYADSLIAKFKEAGGTVREIDV